MFSALHEMFYGARNRIYCMFATVHEKMEISVSNEEWRNLIPDAYTPTDEHGFKMLEERREIDKKIYYLRQELKDLTHMADVKKNKVKQLRSGPSTEEQLMKGDLASKQQKQEQLQEHNDDIEEKIDETSTQLTELRDKDAELRETFRQLRNETLQQRKELDVLKGQFPPAEWESVCRFVSEDNKEDQQQRINDDAKTKQAASELEDLNDKLRTGVVSLQSMCALDKESEFLSALSCIKVISQTQDSLQFQFISPTMKPENTTHSSTCSTSRRGVSPGSKSDGGDKVELILSERSVTISKSNDGVVTCSVVPENRRLAHLMEARLNATRVCQLWTVKEVLCRLDLEDYVDYNAAGPSETVPRCV
eukprot:GHVQ01035701.1.p1 GENE.GHVQ01035701.1~~GHVQ01035701.1.p1  ORF type:complete len:364 (+),score=61.24 GHVQ01035701.1:71-1162(+)